MPNLLVIGCGANRHAVHRNGWNEVTIDVVGAMNPTHQVDITDANAIAIIKRLYGDHFDCIYFENFPAHVLSNDLVQLLVMNAVDCMLRTPGIVRIRTGADGEKLVKQITRLFTRWGYPLVHQAPRDLANLANNLDLAVDPYDVEDPFDLQFRKQVGARRTSATV